MFVFMRGIKLDGVLVGDPRNIVVLVGIAYNITILERISKIHR